MKAVIKLKNTNDSSPKFEILYGINNLNQKNLGLPDGVEIDITIMDKEKDKEHKVSYSEFLGSLLYEPVATIVSSTNNRQLDFFVMDVWGGRNSITPQLTIDGHKRTDNDKWDSKKYNIADTAEKFIMDGKEVISISLEPNQEFQIEFQILARVNISNMIREKILIAYNVRRLAVWFSKG